jgi:hypothetical protein
VARRHNHGLISSIFYTTIISNHVLLARIESYVLTTAVELVPLSRPLNEPTRRIGKNHLSNTRIWRTACASGSADRSRKLDDSGEFTPQRSLDASILTGALVWSGLTIRC